MNAEERAKRLIEELETLKRVEPGEVLVVRVEVVRPNGTVAEMKDAYVTASPA